MVEKFSIPEEQKDVRNLAFQAKENLSNKSSSSTFDVVKLSNSLKFTKQERLKRRKLIQQLFTNRNAVKSGNVTLFWSATVLPTQYPVQATFSVPKRNFKKAVDRNLLKRRLKEAYRHAKGNLYSQLAGKDVQLAFMFIFNSKQTANYQSITKDVEGCLKKIIAKHAANQ